MVVMVLVSLVSLFPVQERLPLSIQKYLETSSPSHPFQTRVATMGLMLGKQYMSPWPKRMQSLNLDSTAVRELDHH